MNKYFLIFLWLVMPICMATDLPLSQLKLPPGFSIEIFADNIPGARSLALGKQGTVFVGTHLDKVYAISGKKIIPIAANLNSPNGVAFNAGNLYVAEVDRIIRFDNIENNLKKVPPAKILLSLPKDKEHGFRYIKIGPDNKLYVGIGVPCNVCVKEDPRFGSIMRSNLDGSKTELFVTGLRNSVGFDWDNKQRLWFTDNGRDYMGDDLPPDKLNMAATPGLNFGFPYMDGKNLPDPDFGEKKPNNLIYTPPTHELPAHVAALGMTFYQANKFPNRFKNTAFIAEHGSWNRSKKIGYQVISAKVQNNQVVEEKPFVTGWLQGQSCWGRPVDILSMPDGSLLISDDFAGVIYRVTYKQ